MSNASPWHAALCREPFRALFPLGILCALLGVGHWLAYAVGWSTTYSGLLHSALQMQAYMACFIVGFLLTALPRFATAPPATGGELCAIIGTVLFQVCWLMAGRWVAAQVCFIALLVELAVFAARRFSQRRVSDVPPPTEFVWIFIALIHGVTGSLLFISGMLGWTPAWTAAAGRPMVQQGFVLTVVLGIAGFMAPRLMGRDVPMAAMTSASPDAVRSWRRRRMLRHVVTGALIWLSFWWEGAGVPTVWVYGLRAVIITTAWWRSMDLPKPPRVTDVYVRLLWVSLWMIVLGYWFIVAWPRHRVEWLHVVFLGGFSLMTFAVGTMVAFSHAGDAQQLRQPSPVLWMVAAAIAIAVTLRVAAVWWPAVYFRLLGVASACWMSGALAWLIMMASRLRRVPAADEFERMHAEAKQRLMPRETAQKHGATSC